MELTVLKNPDLRKITVEFQKHTSLFLDWTGIVEWQSQFTDNVHHCFFPEVLR